jgi:hypothetical protein
MVCWGGEFEFAVAVREALVLARDVVRSEFRNSYLRPGNWLTGFGVDDAT